MAVQIFTNVQALYGSTDFTGQSNEAQLATTFDELDVTTYGSGGWKEWVAGLADTKCSLKGLWSAPVDAEAFADLGVSGVPLTLVPQGNTVGNLAYALSTNAAAYSQGDKVGAVAPFDLSTASQSRAVRGFLMHPSGTSRTTTGSGAGVLVGAATSVQQVYASLHVLAASGTTPSLTVNVQADTSNTFPSPVAVGSFTAATAVGSRWASFAPPASAETYYRVTWTISGTTPSFQFVVALGIA